MDPSAMPLINQVVTDACANGGQLLRTGLELVAGTIAGASIFANLRNRLPAPAVKVLDALACNFIKGVTDAAVAAETQQKQGDGK